MSVEFYMCPGCGAEVRVGSAGCPKCNAGEDLNFDEDGLELDLPEDDTFDYDQFIAEEFGGVPKKSPLQWFWWVVAVVVLIAFASIAIPGCGELFG